LKIAFNLKVAPLIAAACIFASAARADLISVTTVGTFYNSSHISQGNDIGHLTFTGVTKLGPINSDQVLTLGSLDLHNGTFDYDNFTFQLEVNFSVPPGTSGSPVTANLTGSVRGNSGFATLDFPTTLTHFNFATGSFDLTVNELTVDLSSNDGLGTFTGTLSNATSTVSTATVPEPQSLILLATCMTGVGVLIRKRIAHSR
jgi:hypothetical protein